VEIRWLAQEFGVERLGFLTLTFADHVIDNAEANRRLGNLARRVLKGRYKRCIAVRERQASGRIHFHLVVVLDTDIRTGVDFKAMKAGRYQSAGPALRSEWAFWRETAPKYRFGRTELLPVKSNAEGIARYVGSYIGKHVGQRIEADKGAKLVTYIGFKPGQRHAGSNFSFLGERANLWRHKLGQFVERHGLAGMDALAAVCGRHWAYVLEEEIMLTPCKVGHVHESESIALYALELDSVREQCLQECGKGAEFIGCIGTRGREAMRLLHRMNRDGVAVKRKEPPPPLPELFPDSVGRSSFGAGWF